MRTRNILSLLATGFLIFFAACDKQSAIAPKPRQTSSLAASNKPKIVAFGDSLTAGFGLTEKESYPYLLQEKLKADGYDYEVLNAGVSGDTSAGGLERIDWSIEQEGVEILILELGGNDLLRGLSVPEMKGNLTEIVRKAKARKVKVLLCGLFPPMARVGDEQRQFAAVFSEIAKQEKVAFMPFFLQGVGGVKQFNQADGIHPNADGAKILTENVYASLKPLLKSK